MLISVVIPVYNGEHCLSRAVESILPQMSGDVEMVIVNDGSTDGSGRICDEYAVKNNHIRVIHQSNDGLSSARNAGICAASGEYITFLDADDYLDPDTLEKIKSVICSSHPDLIDFGWKYVRQSGETTQNHHKLPKEMLLDRDTIHRDILPPLLNLRHDPDHFIYDFSWAKVYRRCIIENGRIRFDENRRIWEDRPFVVQYLKFCENFYSMGDCLYNYVAMAGSLSQKYSMDFFRIIIENFHLYQQLYGAEYDFDTAYVNAHWSRAIGNMIFLSLEQKEHQQQIRQNIRDTLHNRQVIHWFLNRVPVDSFEKKINGLLASGLSDDALRVFEKYARVNRRKKTTERVIMFVKHTLLRILGRI